MLKASLQYGCGEGVLVI